MMGGIKPRQWQKPASFQKLNSSNQGKNEKILQINPRNTEKRGSKLREMMHGAAFSKTVPPGQKQ